MGFIISSTQAMPKARRAQDWALYTAVCVLESALREKNIHPQGYNDEGSYCKFWRSSDPERILKCSNIWHP